MSDINPRVDIAFKKIFGVEENKDLLISLINSIVGNDDQISDVTLLNPYNPRNFKNDKLSILDIKASGIDGKKFNIEIQITDEDDYDKRALFYWGKLYTEQLKAGEDYGTLSKAIGIHILNFTSIPEVKKYHNVFHIREKDDGILYFKDLELHTIELKKFSADSKEELSEIMSKVKNSLDMWSMFLTRHELLNTDNLPKKLNDNNLKKALGVLEVMNFTSEEREAYEDHLKWLRIEANTLKKAESKGRAAGLEQGIQQGIKQGIEKGIEQGIEKGIELRNQQIAINMLKENVNDKIISSATGLALEKIIKLKGKL